jgi:hypothetical protein
VWRLAVPPAGHGIAPLSNFMNILVNSRLIDDDKYVATSEIADSRIVATITNTPVGYAAELAITTRFGALERVARPAL